MSVVFSGKDGVFINYASFKIKITGFFVQIRHLEVPEYTPLQVST